VRPLKEGKEYNVTRNKKKGNTVMSGKGTVGGGGNKANQTFGFGVKKEFCTFDCQ